MKLLEFVIFGIIILLLDIPFITYIVTPQYKIPGLQLNPLFALCAYLVMISAWVLIQGDQNKGALVGFIVYGVYAFTLAAILPSYKFFPTGLIETTWGTILFTLATILTKKITS
jgi:hypothetical protein